MGSLFAYSGISTKIRGMRSKILTDKDYEQLAQLATVSEAAEFLKKFPAFKEVFSEVEAHTLHRSTIEQLLFSAEYFDFVKIYRFCNMELREFLDLFFLNYEQIFLKESIRSILEHQQLNLQAVSLGDFFVRHTSFSCEKIVLAKTLEEFMHALEGSPYYSYLHPLQRHGDSTLFDYEMAIDSYVFSKIWKQQKKKFSGENYKTLCKTFGCQIDLLNLMWIYRSKRYYEMDVSEIYMVLLPVHYKLKKSMVCEMVEAESWEEFETLLEKTYYGSRYLVEFEREENGFYLERIYNSLLYHIHNKEFRNHPYSVAAINSYLYLKHLETQRLITTIEGIRYGLPPQSIIEYEKRYNLEVLNR